MAKLTFYNRLQTHGYLGMVTPAAQSLVMSAKDVYDTANSPRGVAYVKIDDAGMLMLQPRAASNIFAVANCGYANGDGITILPDGTNQTMELVSTWTALPNQPFRISVMMFGTQVIEQENGNKVNILFGDWICSINQSQSYIYKVNNNWDNTTLDPDIKPRELVGDTYINSSSPYDVVQQINFDKDSTKSAVGEYYHLWFIPVNQSGLLIGTGANPFFRDSENVQFIRLIRAEPAFTGGQIRVRARNTSFTVSGTNILFANQELESNTYIGTRFVNGHFDKLKVFGYTGNDTSLDAYPLSTPEIGNTFRLHTVLEAGQNGFFTPFLTSLSASIDGGAYNVIDYNKYDSNIDRDVNNNTPILDIEMTCEGEMRRRQCEISIRNARQLREQLNSLPLMLENQLATVSVGISPNNLVNFITGGIITPSGMFDVAGENAAHPWTEVRLTVNDKWKIADDRPCGTIIPGDGMPLGEYVSYVLRTAGFGAQEIDIDEEIGATLPRADVGDAPIVLPSQEQSVGDFLRQLMDYWGYQMSLLVSPSTGKWLLVEVSDDLALVEGVEAKFSSDWETHKQDTTHGRLRVLKQSDVLYNTDDFYNMIRVEGAEVAGKRISETYVDYDSVANANSHNFIGRLKPMDTVRDDRLNTQEKVSRVVRSLRERYTLSNRMIQFETYFHLQLRTGHRIEVDGTPYRIVNIASASILNDRMRIVARRLQ